MVVTQAGEPGVYERSCPRESASGRREGFMRIAAIVIVALGASASEPSAAYAEDADRKCKCAAVELTGPPKLEEGRAELSGLVFVDNATTKFMAISNATFGCGRDVVLQIYEGDPSGGYHWQNDVPLFEPGINECADADFEGLTGYRGVYFAIASHSRDRRKQVKDLPYKINCESLTAGGIDYCPSRDQVKRFHLGNDGKPTDVKTGDLMSLMVNDPFLAPYVALPSKENGVDIEGIAATKDFLFVGFKGPVFRQNYVPILQLDHDFNPVLSPLSSSPVLFVDLGGRGVRDMTAGPGGKDLYILAGPNGNEDQGFAIYQWDGEDHIGGQGRGTRKPIKRCELGHFKPSGKPEGIAYIGPGDGGERFLLIYDGDDLQAQTVVLEPPN
jgi:hypothetical protein